MTGSVKHRVRAGLVRPGAVATTAYRLARNAAGGWRWYGPHHRIPVGCTNARAATPEEVEMMGCLVRHDPCGTLALRVARLRSADRRPETRTGPLKR